MQQFLVDAVIDLKHGRIHDCHVQAGTDGMIEECRVHRLADGVVAAEGEREIGESSGGEGSWEIGLYPSDCLDEIHSVTCMLGYACAYREDVAVENYVLRSHSGLLGKQPVGPFADFNLAPVCCRLSLLVECHDDYRSSHLLDNPGFMNKCLFSFL